MMMFMLEMLQLVRHSKSDMRRSIGLSDSNSVHIKTVQTKKVGRVNKQIGNSILSQV